MTVTETAPESIDERDDVVAETSDTTAVVEEVLVEEISIDGMCGVY
ncbi:mycofactocin precursor MftA [Actinospongicola halichondriae]